MKLAVYSDWVTVKALQAVLVVYKRHSLLIIVVSGAVVVILLVRFCEAKSNSFQFFAQIPRALQATSSKLKINFIILIAIIIAVSYHASAKVRLKDVNLPNESWPQTAGTTIWRKTASWVANYEKSILNRSYLPKPRLAVWSGHSYSTPSDTSPLPDSYVNIYHYYWLGLLEKPTFKNLKRVLDWVKSMQAQSKECAETRISPIKGVFVPMNTTGMSKSFQGLRAVHVQYVHASAKEYDWVIQQLLAGAIRYAYDNRGRNMWLYGDPLTQYSLVASLDILLISSSLSRRSALALRFRALSLSSLFIGRPP